MKRVVLTFILSAILVFPSYSFAAEKIIDGIAAVVNGEVITLYDVNKGMEPVLSQFRGREISDVEKDQIEAFRKQLLDRMVNDAILEQEAKSLGVSVSEDDVNGELQSIMENSNISKEELEKKLQLQKTNLADFKNKIRDNIRKHRLLNYKVKNKVVVTEEEMEKYWNSTQSASGSSKPKKMHLKLILFPNGVDAAAIRTEIVDKKVTFEEAADKYTQGPGSGQGGDLGDLSLKDLAETWQDVLNGLKPGEISEIFNVQGMDAVLKLDSYVAEKKASFEEMKDKIYDKLYGEKQDAVFADYIKKLREKAVIEIK